MAVDVRVPGDKSITHRALIFSALADGTSRIAGGLDAADIRSTAGALRALGTPVSGAGPSGVVVRGRGLGGWSAPGEALDCGNSGTTARLLLGAVAGCPFEVRMTGDASLQGRPMGRVTEPLREAGATFEELGEPGRLPLRVRGRRPLADIAHESPRASAQVKSALLLAGLTGGSMVQVSEPWLSRDHTERMLRAMGARIESVRKADLWVVRQEPLERLEPVDLTVPGDPSAAAFFLALGALLGPVRVGGMSLNPTRTGALDVLVRMGATVSVSGTGEAAGEPVGDVVVEPNRIGDVFVGPSEVPSLLDEVPVLAALAAAGEGEARFDGVAELRVKESDRVAALVSNLRALGVETEEGPDHLVVRGRGRPLRGAVRSFGDHRIAMAFGVLASVPGSEIEIDGREAVGISFPGYWTELERVRTELLRT